MKPSSRNLMVIVALVGSIHAAIADEASDAVQVLSKLWMANVVPKHALTVTIRNMFVGDAKTYKMRFAVHGDDGTVEGFTDEALFRVLEEDQAPEFASLDPQSSIVAVKCLFRRACFDNVVHFTSDPIYNPKAEPKKRLMLPHSSSYGFVSTRESDQVKRALRTLLRLNAAPPFEPPR